MKHIGLAGTLAALLLIAPLSGNAADAQSGTYHGLQWSLEDHILTVSGTGEIYCYTNTFPDGDLVEYPAWKPYAEDIYEIVIGEGVTGAQEYALADYPNLETLTLPSTFTSLAPYALQNDAKLSAINGLEHVTDFHFACLSGTAYIAENPFVITDGKLYYAECTDFTVPEGVTEIMPFAFGNLTGNSFLPENAAAVPVQITLPDTVEVIHDSAFAFCAGLSEINLPDGLREIGDHAFFDCAHLGSLTLGEQVEYVGESAFFNCKSMETLTVLNPDTAFAPNAFGSCYDWKAAGAARLSEADYEKMLAELAKQPFCMDEQMAAFAVHFLGTRPYSSVSYQSSDEEFLCKQGTVAGFRDSTAQSFAADNALRFEMLDAAPGDVNLDGILDILDVIALNKFCCGISDLSTRSRLAADLNADNIIDSDDSLAVLRLILGIKTI